MSTHGDSRRPTINLPVNASATAFGEGLHLEFELIVCQGGESVVRVWARRSHSYRKKNILTFDMHEWARIKKCFGVVDELIEKVESGGASFRIGDE